MIPVLPPFRRVLHKISARPAVSGGALALLLLGAATVSAPVGAQPVAQAEATPGIAVIQAPEGESTLDAGGYMALTPQGAPPDPLALAAPPPPAARGPAGMPPVVVELFTAQGCSSCPPADALVAALAGRADVLPLAWHVDYWDYLGWADDFARPEHTARQEAYADVAGERGVYTPQIIVDGQDTLITVQRGSLVALIDEHAARPAAVSVTARGQDGRFVIDLMPRAAIPGGVDITLIRYADRRSVTIRAGENRGRTVEYANIVLGAETLNRWDARTPLRLTVTPGSQPDGRFPDDTRHAILAQQTLPGGLPGPILAAIRLD